MWLFWNSIVRRTEAFLCPAPTAKAQDHFLIQEGTEDHLVFDLLHCIGEAHESEFQNDFPLDLHFKKSSQYIKMGPQILYETSEQFLPATSCRSFPD